MKKCLFPFLLAVAITFALFPAVCAEGNAWLALQEAVKANGTVTMVFVFLSFALFVFAVCRIEIMYYIHRIARKFKPAKKTSHIAYEEEPSEAKKPDKMKFVGKVICCLPVLIIYGYLAMLLAFNPEGGYTEDSIEPLYIAMVSVCVISLLCVIFGLLLCCYSRLRKNAHDIEEIHAFIELQQAKEKDANDLN